MKRSIILFFPILVLSNDLYGQNKTTPNGLKTGFWKFQYNREYDESYREGRYKVVSIKQLDTISEDRFSHYLTVPYKKGTTWMAYEERKADSLEVKDGLWKWYDTTGLKLESLVKYKRGIRLWSKKFDANGSLSSHSYTDFIKRITYYESYNEGKLFSRSYYPPEKTSFNDEIVVYYPKSRLFISNAEPRFDYNFLSKEHATQTIQIACKKPLKILAITSHSANFQIQPPHSFPHGLKPQDTLNLQLTYVPSPTSAIEQDTITIKTLENGSIQEYRILALTSAVHVDYQNVQKIAEIRLSQTQDRYLLIDRLGTQTDACLMTEPENTCFEALAGPEPHIRIDLKSFKPGVYGFYINSCNTFASFRLVITE